MKTPRSAWPAVMLAILTAPGVFAAELTEAFNRRDSAAFQTLLERNPALAREAGPGGRPWLVLAAEQGLTNMVVALLAAKADVNASVPGLQETALHAAARAAQADVVRLLLAAKADVNARSVDGSTPLHLAIPQEFAQPPALRPAAQQFVEDGEGNAVALPVSGGRSTRPDPQRERQEREARRQLVVAQLAAAGAELFATNRFSTPATPWLRALHYRQTNLLDTLLLHTPRVRDRDAAGDTPVHLAIRHARFHTLPALAAKQADPGATNAAGLTPMQALVLLAAPPAVARDAADPEEPPGYFVLLGTGAKLDPFSLAGLGKVAELTVELQRDSALVRARDPRGRTLLHWAAMKGNQAAVALLLARGAAVDAADQSGRLALHEAAERGYTPVLEQLLVSRATLNARDAAGRSALEWAATGGHESAAAFLLTLKPELEPARAGLATALHRAVDSQSATIVEALLAAGARADARDEQQQTSLHHAAGRAGTNITVRLLATGVEVNARDAQGRTPLDFAITSGLDQTAALLLARGAQIAPAANGVTTPLHLAARTGNHRLAALLLARGASPHPTNEAGLTPFLVAAQNTQLPMMGALLAAGADINARDAKGNTALQLALTGRNEYAEEEPMDDEWARLFRSRLAGLFREWVAVLDPDSPLIRTVSRQQQMLRVIQAGQGMVLPQIVPVPEAAARAPVAGWRGWLVDELARLAGGLGVDLSEQAQQMAVFRWRQKPWRYLLVSGADVRGTNVSGHTPLHLVAQWQFWEGMPASRSEVPALVLLRRGADVNARDAEGHTPLHLAAKAGNIPLIRTLVQLKADANATNQLGQTALHVGVATRQTYSPTMVKQLLEGGAHVNARDRDGNTPLHLAVTDPGQREVVKALIEAKADQSAANQLGQTPLQAAVLAGQQLGSEIANLLIEAGASPNMKDKDGSTLLHLAVMKSNITAIRWLLKHHADVSATNRLGQTPLQLAKASKKQQMVDLFERHEAVKSPATAPQNKEPAVVPSSQLRENPPRPVLPERKAP